jgi:hypothetical protein
VNPLSQELAIEQLISLSIKGVDDSSGFHGPIMPYVLVTQGFGSTPRPPVLTALSPLIVRRQPGRRMAKIPPKAIASHLVLLLFLRTLQRRHACFDIQIQRLARESEDTQRRAYFTGRRSGGIYHQLQKNRAGRRGILLDAGGFCMVLL